RFQGTRSCAVLQTHSQTWQPSSIKTEEKEMPAKFPFGKLVATPGALDALERTGQSSLEFLSRHASGDCGEVCEADKKENDFSVRNGFRLFSAYRLRDGT